MSARLTSKQLSIMNLVFRGNGSGGAIDIDDLWDRIDYRASKQALQCSIRFLEKHELLRRDYVNRRERRRMVLIPTAKAFETLRGKASAPGEISAPGEVS